MLILPLLFVVTLGGLGLIRGSAEAWASFALMVVVAFAHLPSLLFVLRARAGGWRLSLWSSLLGWRAVMLPQYHGIVTRDDAARLAALRPEADEWTNLKVAHDLAAEYPTEEWKRHQRINRIFSLVLAVLGLVIVCYQSWLHSRPFL